MRISMKTCKCGETDVMKFSRNARRHDGLQSQCIVCQRESNRNSIRKVRSKATDAKIAAEPDDNKRWNLVLRKNRAFEHGGTNEKLLYEHMLELDHALGSDQESYSGITEAEMEINAGLRDCTMWFYYETRAKVMLYVVTH
jgi:hypothetical protein